MTEIDTVGLYVHIPYCVRKCNYCDFCSLPQGGQSVPDLYVDRLCMELLTYKKEPKIALATIYFGGGTPSLLTPAQMKPIVSCINDVFDLSRVKEFSIEANPGTVTFEKARAYKNIGFNRISLGLQSIHEKEMKTLGRIHSFKEFLETYNTLRSVGFDNINIDLMYGIPYQTKDSFRSTLEKVIALRPEHISAYGLIVEEGTPFYDMRDKLPLPSLDDECDMYYDCCDILAKAGYGHYEISNYAQPGKESLHNLIYWNMDSYIGVGASAHSYFCGKRYFNTSNVDDYILGNGICDGAEELSPDDQAYEYAMLKLRLKEGFSLDEYRERFDRDFLEGKEELIEHMTESGLVLLSDGRLSLSEQGFYLSNSILVEIL